MPHRQLGQPAHDSFQTVALYENKDMLAVIRQIHSLGRVAQKLGYSGPILGAKLATENQREFTHEQLADAKNATTFLGKGSHGTVGGAMTKIGGGKKYATVADVEGLDGLGVGGELGLVGKGGTGTAGASMSMADAGRQIDKMSKVAGEVAGLGIGGETTILGQGSTGTAAASVSKIDAGRDINKLAGVQ